MKTTARNMMFWTLVTWLCWKCPPTWSFPAVSLDDFENGRFAVPLSDKAIPDKEAEERLVALVEWFQTLDHAAKAKCRALGEDAFRDDFPPLYFRYRNLEECDAFLKLCYACEGKEAGLTAVLLLGARALHWPRQARVPVREAVKQVRARFPKSWQAKVLPPLETALGDRGEGPEREESMVRAIAVMKETIPDKAFVLDERDPQVQAFVQLYPFKLPPRAGFLRFIALNQYNLGTIDKSGLSKYKFDRDYFKEAITTCHQIIEEFPGTEHEKFARDMLNDIPETTRALQRGGP